MRIEQLQYFLDICRTQSINESAKNLYISQPALTKSIQALEKELGVVLFERSNKGIYPTTVGQAFLSYAERATASFNEAVNFINRLTTFQKPLNIYALPILANDLIPFLIEQLSHMFPNLIIDYSEVMLDNLKQILEEKPNALVFFCDENESVNNSKYPMTEVESFFIQEDEILAYVSKHSPYANLDKMTNEVLSVKNKKKMVYNNNHSLASQLFESNHSQNAEVCAQLILHQNAVLYYSSELGERKFGHIEDIISLPVDPPIKITFMMAVNNKLIDDEFIKVVDFCKKLLSNIE